MNKEYNWRVADWTDPEDFSAEAEKDCEKIQEVSSFTDYETNVIPLTTLKKVEAFINCEKSLKEAQ